jgi:hypothetical protein
MLLQSTVRRNQVMKKSFAGKVGIILVALMLGGMASLPSAPLEGSGFLRDYSNLTETRDARGNTIWAWVSPKLKPANYNAILFDPLVFYPEPRPSEQVSAETLNQILAYSNDTLKRSFSQRFTVVDRAGPGVLRIRAAFTSVAARGQGLKPYQVIPMAFVATMDLWTAAGKPERAFIVVEVEGTDSTTGELLGQRVRVRRPSIMHSFVCH